MRTFIALLSTLFSSAALPACAQEAVLANIQTDVHIPYVPSTINWARKDRPWVERSVVMGHEVVRRGHEWTIAFSGPLSFVTDTIRSPRFSNLGTSLDLGNDVSMRVFAQSSNRVRKTCMFAGFAMRF